MNQTSTVTATVQDSIGCVATCRWTTPGGSLANAAQRQTVRTAPNQEGTAPVTITVTCPSDGKTAADTVNIVVTRPPVRTCAFDDVYFDFDRYSLRPDAGRVLGEVVNAVREDPTLRIQIEGHTATSERRNATWRSAIGAPRRSGTIW